MIISIPIPTDGKCLLKKGNSVDFDTPYLDAKESEKIHIPLAKLLNISPSSIFKYLKKFVGDDAKKGDVIAVRKTIFSSHTVISEYNGVIQEVNHSEGTITITSEDGKKNTINAYFKGEIVNINDKILELKVKTAKEFLLKKTTDFFGGETAYIKTSSPLFSSDIENKIIVTDSFVSYEITKAEVLGIKGFVFAKEVPTTVSSCVLKDRSDLKDIFELHYPYCFIDKKKCIIIFYA